MAHATASSPASAEIIAFRSRAHESPTRDGAGQEALASLIPVLDQLDHGIVLHDVDGRAHLNRLADLELAEPGGPLHLRDGSLSATAPDEAALLRRALSDASLRGRRHVLTLHGPTRTLSVSIAPVQGAAACAEPVPALVMLPRGSLCSCLAAQWFASTHGLSTAETSVFAELLAGQDPAGIAASHGVAISTVRTQLSSIKAKTSTRSLRHLLMVAAQLPPLVPVAGRIWR